MTAFISYPTSGTRNYSNGEFIITLVSKILQSNGFSTWNSYNISVGNDWQKEIEKAIRGSNLFVSIIDNELSAEQLYEINYAIERKIPILPIVDNQMTGNFNQLSSIKSLFFDKNDLKNLGQNLNVILEKYSQKVLEVV